MYMHVYLCASLCVQRLQIEAIGKRTTEHNEINKIEELIRPELVISEIEKKIAGRTYKV